jgi:hypothetical protein
MNEHFGSASPNATDGYFWRLGNLAPGNVANISLVTTRTAPLTSAQAPDDACLAANNGRDACTDAARSATAPVTTVISGIKAEQFVAPRVIKPISVSVATPAPQPTPAPLPVAAAPVVIPQVQVAASAPAQVTPTTQTISGSSASSNQVYTPVSPSMDNGVWEWTSAYGMSSASAQQIVNNAAASGFNVIYMTVDSSLNLSGTQLTNYEASLNNLLTAAAAKNISVDAEAGASDWALPGNWSNPEAIVSFVANYNQTHQVKFRGVQFDVEPYSLSQYTSDPAGILTDYTQMVEALVNQDKNFGMPLGFCVPFFYTSYAHAPQITVDGITTYPANQLVRLLNELPNGRLMLMAYRNTANGSDGTLEISTPYLQAANGTKVKVIVGQETGNVQPSYITFFGMTKVQMAAQVAIINQAFASNSSFGGIAVDYLEPYMQLK